MGDTQGHRKVRAAEVVQRIVLAWRSRKKPRLTNRSKRVDFAIALGQYLWSISFFIFTILSNDKTVILVNSVNFVISKTQSVMQFDEEKYKVYTWKNWMMLHWVLNPGLAINELILGQRVPKISLEEKASDKPRIERSFVPCPHCETLHDGRTWSTANGTGFKNWFGLYCNNCGGVIPCLMNVCSFLVLAITFPVWGFFRSGLRAKWLEKQPARYNAVDVENTPNAFGNGSWLRSGIGFGGTMFVLMALVFPVLGGEDLVLSTLLIEFVIWMLGGLLFGFVMKVFLAQTGGSK